jgi:iron complex transport system ATP-binding protein
VPDQREPSPTQTRVTGLQVSDLGFGFTGRGWVFRGVSFTVPPGSITAVLGPNGRGKTTLVRCVAGLLTSQEGHVRSDGAIGYVPQARAGAFAYRVLEMVVMGRARQVAVFSSPGPEDRVAAQDALTRVGIAHLADRQFPKLSGGEQQLVLIARAIASESPILALDEPSASLDLHNQARILSLLGKLAADGMSILLTTHHPDHALQLADSAVLMSTDTVHCGSASDMLTDDNLTALYGIGVHTVGYHRNGQQRQVLVTDYSPTPAAR